MMLHARALVLVFFAGAMLAGCSHGPEPKKVALITAVGGIGDGSINDSAVFGLKTCAAQFGAQIRIVEPHDADDIAAAALRLATQDYGEIIGVGTQTADPLGSLAQRFATTHFTIVGAPAIGPNVESIRIKREEGAYLAGALAAQVSSSGTIGLLGGAPVAQVRADLAGYTAGAHAARPRIRIVSDLRATFDDAAKAETAAARLAAQGADVTFVVAGRAGLAAIAYIKTRPHGYAIGVDADQDALAPGRMLGSVVTNAGAAVQQACEDSIGLKPVSGTTELGLADGAIALTRPAAAAAVVTPAIWGRVEAMRAAIIAGKPVPSGEIAGDEPQPPPAAGAVLVAPPGIEEGVDRGRLGIVWGTILIGGFLVFFGGTSAAVFWIRRRN
jgi:basic membrane protein A